MRRRGILLSLADQRRLFNARVNAGLSRKNLSDISKVSRRWINRAERQAGVRVDEEVLVLVAHALGYNVRYILGKEPHRKSNQKANFQTAEQTKGSELVPPLNGEIVVSVWDHAISRYRSISEHGLPVYIGTQVSICLTLNRPAFICVVWISSAGEATPLYPWKGRRWDSSITADQVATLLLPPKTTGHLPEGYPIDTRAGTETAVLLARAQPLPPELGSTLADIFDAVSPKLARLQMTNPNRPYLFSCDDSDVPKPSTVRLGKPHLVDDPRLQLKLDLCERLRIHFDVIKGVCISNAGKPKQSHEQASGEHSRPAR